MIELGSTLSGDNLKEAVMAYLEGTITKVDCINYRKL